jgi:hypothetical protein
MLALLKRSEQEGVHECMPWLRSLVCWFERGLLLLVWCAGSDTLVHDTFSEVCCVLEFIPRTLHV